MISKFFINRPRFAFVLSILFLLAGGIAIMVLPVAQYPDIAPSQIQVSANYPGADAQTVMNTVIQPIEQQVNGVKRMLYMSSTATDSGSAVITVTFGIGTDGDTNTVNTQNRVNWAEAQLPEEVQRQGLTVKEKSSNILLVVSLFCKDGTVDSLALSNFLSINVVNELARIPGVANVSQFGELTYAMRIWLDSNKLASLGLNVSDVTDAISEQNVQVSAGAIGEAPTGQDQMIRIAVSTLGRLEKVEEFENIVLKVLPDGSNITIGNVGRVELGAETYNSTCVSNGQNAAALVIYQLNDANGLDIAKQSILKMEELKKTVFPSSLDYRIQYDSTQFISSSIEEVVKTLYEAIFLVILVTFIFLQDWRSALVPTIAIPVSLVGTFAAMYLLGYSINLITLFGLILAIGIVVDDAIVVIENVNRLMDEEGLDPKSAALKSMEQVTSPVIATTAVLLAMFIPVCFLPGITGVMYRQFAVTISISVTISSINALTLSPALSSVLLKPREPGARKFFFFRWFDFCFERVTTGYMMIAKHLIRKAALVLILLGSLLFLSYRLFETIPSGFVPDEDQGTFFINVQLPDGASLVRTQAVMEKVDARLKNIPGVRDYLSVGGYNMINGVNVSNSGFGIVTLKNWSERKEPGMSQDDIIKKFRAAVADIPEAVIVPFGVPSIPGIGTTGGFSFMLEDRSGNMTPVQMQDIANDFVLAANEDPALSGVFATFRASLPQYYLEVDRQKAKKMGVSLSSVNSALEGLFGSTYVNNFNKYGQSYQVIVQADIKNRKTVDDIPKIKIRNDAGEMVPFGTIATVKTRFVPQFLTRYNMYTSVQINGNPASGYSSGQAMAAMERLARETLPEGLSYEWTDMSYQEKLAGGQIYMIFALALVFIYLFLVAQYESWMIPYSVIMSVPVAIFGALMSLYLLDLFNNIYAQVGFVILVGIACKTAILIVEFAKEQHEHGLGIVEAAEYAAKLRFRAVMMTAISFILGTYPLVVAYGASSVSRRSLGTAVFGGMLVSVMFGTFMIPAFYVIIQWTIERFAKKWSLPVGKNPSKGNAQVSS